VKEEYYIALDPEPAPSLSAASHLTCPCGQSNVKEFEHTIKKRKKESGMKKTISKLKQEFVCQSPLTKVMRSSVHFFSLVKEKCSLTEQSKAKQNSTELRYSNQPNMAFFPLSCLLHHILHNTVGVEASSFMLHNESSFVCTSFCFLCGECSRGACPS